MIENYIIRFKNFKSKTDYIELQRDFLGFDYKKQYFTIIETNDRKEIDVMKFKDPLENPSIIIYSRDSNNNEDFLEFSFKEDFILPKIENMATPAFEYFKKSIQRKGLYSEELLQGYAKEDLNLINVRRNDFEDAKYLDNVIKNKLLQELEKLENMIDKYLSNPLPALKTKIPINWSRTDIIYFFHLLRENKVIGNIGEADLGRLIDNAFEYFDVKDKEYKEIKNSKKHLNAFSNDDGRPAGPSNERLKKVFQNENFYNN